MSVSKKALEMQARVENYVASIGNTLIAGGLTQKNYKKKTAIEIIQNGHGTIFSVDILNLYEAEIKQMLPSAVIVNPVNETI